MKPQCPVLFNEIKFSYLNNKQRAVKAIRKATDDNIPVMMPFGSVHIPSSDYSDTNEENRSYVFPACGHVHGYHPSMLNKPCPLCRKMGPFVPIAFTFEPAVCDKKPTHVFNPCGHIASLQTCRYWSEIPMFSRNLPSFDMNPICPFCATELVCNESNNITDDNATALSGMCYNRLILQTESGETWPADCSLEEQDRVSAKLQNDCKSLDEIVKSQQLLFARNEKTQRIANTHHDTSMLSSSLRDDDLHNEKNPFVNKIFPKYVPQLLMQRNFGK